VHFGPIIPGYRCECCGKHLSIHDLQKYWRIKAAVRRMRDEALSRFATPNKGKAR
jgi:hypothetical protein